MNKKSLLVSSMLMLFAFGCSKVADQPADMQESMASDPSMTMEENMSTMTDSTTPTDSTMEQTSDTAMPMDQETTEVNKESEKQTAVDNKISINLSEEVKDNKQATVISATHANNYTFMEVEANGTKFWIATTTLEVKTGDTVIWKGASVMKNFTSKSLQKTFDEIVFVSYATVSS